jgi:hypothetical protein
MQTGIDRQNRPSAGDYRWLDRMNRGLYFVYRISCRQGAGDGNSGQRAAYSVQEYQKTKCKIPFLSIFGFYYVVLHFDF